jgi:FkbM family methyltransferase
MFSRVRRLPRLVSTLGLQSATQFLFARLPHLARLCGFQTLCIHPKFLQHPLIVRINPTSSDLAVFSQIFVTQELRTLAQSVALHHPKVVLDLGANVGYTSAFLLNALPGAFVLAVEPDPENAAICRQNLAPYGNRALVVEGAVWPARGTLVLSRGTFGDGRDWATEVRPPHPGESAAVQAWDVPSLIALCPSPRIDLAKIDIEGSEAVLFQAPDTSWLDSIANLCIELHGPHCQAAVQQALGPYQSETESSGEYCIFRNLQRKSR